MVLAVCHLDPDTYLLPKVPAGTSRDDLLVIPDLKKM